MSTNGLYSLIENLTPLQGLNWAKCPSGVDPADLPKANAIAAFIKECLVKEKTPEGLSQNAWFFAEKNQLSTIDPAENGALDFNALEDFAIECSSGNDAVRKYLLKSSGLSAQPIADYYKKVVKSSLKGKDMDLIHQLAIYGCGDKKVLQRARNSKMR